MSSILKKFAKDAEVMEALKDPDTLHEVLFILQDTTDHFMNETSKLLDDSRASVQEQAQKTLELAKAIMEAEKKIREAELYNAVSLKQRNLNHLIDV
ncbi:MAG: hypothetical protein HYR97_00760 [Candidatus Melainabacteria bacterium]|nr:hypothetical protein [Candidatus Melainabacteria bacterium]MBI3308491.1 hypothetical protein [Candidatus Melainabacteria bacterium]